MLMQKTQKLCFIKIYDIPFIKTGFSIENVQFDDYS